MPQIILKERAADLASYTFLQEMLINIKTRHFHSSMNYKEQLFYRTLITSYFRPVYIAKFLKLASAMFYQILIFSQNDGPLKTMKNVFLIHLKSSFYSRDIQTFVIFSLPFHTFQIQKDKWKWNNL